MTTKQLDTLTQDIIDDLLSRSLIGPAVEKVLLENPNFKKDFKRSISSSLQKITIQEWERKVGKS